MSALPACFDVRLRSTLALPELLPAAGDDPRAIVEVSEGPLPSTLPGAAPAHAMLQAAGDAALLTVPGVARYLVTGGRAITVDAAPGATEREVRVFLLGSALGVLCHQRGLLPIHANAVVVGGRAHAFAGVSGAGKSTLAAWFARAGHPVLSDDVCAVDLSGPVPLAWPGIPRVKLWGEAAGAFGIARAGLEPVIAGMDKYQVPLAAPPPAGPVPFAALYLLERAAEGASFEVSALPGAAAAAAVIAHTYRAAYLVPMVLQTRQFAQAAALLRHARVFRVARAWGYDRFDAEASRLRELLAA